MSDTYKIQEEEDIETTDSEGNTVKKHKSAKFVEVEIAMAYTVSQKENVYSFVNNINTYEGGTHVSGFRTALTRTINDIAKQMNIKVLQGRLAKLGVSNLGVPLQAVEATLARLEGSDGSLGGGCRDGEALRGTLDYSDRESVV